ncbi:hypothetical protein ACSSWA_01535 [Melioribacter sp. Ez-97]|uniref:hypothetical protein n=1 Tax=Melioribacter sp. Ez-97 TaxID=3423434 RepID=UPI003ED9E923
MNDIKGIHEKDEKRLNKLHKIDNYEGLLNFIIEYVFENQIHLNEYDEVTIHFYKEIINQYYRIKESINETDEN